MEQEQNEKQEIDQSTTVELTTADGKKKKIKDSKYYVSTRKICYVALFTALNIVMSSSICSIPVPGGHLYLNDIVICLASLVLDPLSAFIVGGVGAFFGDMLFYPAPMFVSLVTHGLQAVAISLIAGKKNELAPLWKAIVAVAVGAVIMVTGYSLGRAFIYSTPEYAIIKLPFQILQALVGAALGTVFLYATPIKRYSGFIPKD